MFKANNRKSSSSSVTIQRVKKRNIESEYQTFDQKSVFANTEETTGNLLGVVKKSGMNPVVQVMSNATKFRSDWPIYERQRKMAEKKPDPNKKPTFIATKFKRLTSTMRAKGEAQKLNPGDIVELEKTMLNMDETSLHPWRCRYICEYVFGKTLPMPECPSTIIVEDGNEEGENNYKIAIAARGEASTITDVSYDIAKMKDLLGGDDPFINGFVLRGSNPGSAIKKGITCYRTKSDNDKGLLDDQIIFKFINDKVQGLMNIINEENPWEIIPLYMASPSKLEKDQLARFAKKYPRIATTEAKRYQACFAHCNVVLQFRDSNEIPVIKFFGMSRDKPLILESGIPERATENRLTTLVS
jgi:hypothetical protein